jgi:hypothetical protein
MFSSDLPEIDQTVRASIASMLGRPIPDEAATKDMIFKQYVSPLISKRCADETVSEQPHLLVCGTRPNLKIAILTVLPVGK